MSEHDGDFQQGTLYTLSWDCVGRTHTQRHSKDQFVKMFRIYQSSIECNAHAIITLPGFERLAEGLDYYTKLKIQ